MYIGEREWSFNYPQLLNRCEKSFLKHDIASKVVMSCLNLGHKSKVKSHRLCLVWWFGDGIPIEVFFPPSYIEARKEFAFLLSSCWLLGLGKIRGNHFWLIKKWWKFIYITSLQILAASSATRELESCPKARTPMFNISFAVEDYN